MKPETELHEDLERSQLTDREVQDLLDGKAADDRQRNARDEFIKRLSTIPAAQVAAEVDQQVGLLSPAEAEAFKARAQKLIDERMAQQVEQCRHQLADVETHVEDARSQGVALEADWDELATEISTGQLDLDDALATFRRLDREMDRIIRQRQEHADRLASLRDREANPERYFDEFERRYPAVRLALGGPPRLH